MENDCNNGSDKKGLIIQALVSYGGTDGAKLAKCIEDGKVSIDGCSTFRIEANKALQTILKRKEPQTPEEVRKFVNSANRIIGAEMSALRSKKTNETRFYQNINDALEDSPRDRKTDELSNVEYQINRKKEELSRLEYRRDRLASTISR